MRQRRRAIDLVWRSLRCGHRLWGHGVQRVGRRVDALHCRTFSVILRCVARALRRALQSFLCANGRLRGPMECCRRHWLRSLGRVELFKSCELLTPVLDCTWREPSCEPCTSWLGRSGRRGRGSARRTRSRLVVRLEQRTRHMLQRTLSGRACGGTLELPCLAGSVRRAPRAHVWQGHSGWTGHVHRRSLDHAAHRKTQPRNLAGLTTCNLGPGAATATVSVLRAGHRAVTSRAAVRRGGGDTRQRVAHPRLLVLARRTAVEPRTRRGDRLRIAGTFAVGAAVVEKGCAVGVCSVRRAQRETRQRVAHTHLLGIATRTAVEPRTCRGVQLRFCDAVVRLCSALFDGRGHRTAHISAFTLLRASACQRGARRAAHGIGRTGTDANMRHTLRASHVVLRRLCASHHRLRQSMRPACHSCRRTSSRRA